MKSRALRLTLLTLFVGAIGGAAYFVWKEESQGRVVVGAARSFDDRVRAASRSLLDVRSSQPGYVAAGQGDDFWAARVDVLFKSTRESLTALRSQAQTPQSVSELDAAATAFEDFAHMDRRARDYVRNGQRLLASDLIFSDGIEKIDTALASLERARDAELTTRDQVIQLRRRTQIAATAGAAAVGLLIVFVLVPLPGGLPPAGRAAIEDLPLRAAHEPAPRIAELRPSIPPNPVPVVVEPPAAAIDPLPATPAPSPAATPVAPAVDLPGIAALSTELSRVVDTRALPAALERAAALLDASGIVIWIADPDGRELAPIIAHGYPQNLVSRMGLIGRDAENVTAAAFRTGLVQTLNSDAVSHGAIAAPLLTPTGAVGVMAAEVLNDGERKDTTRAVAVIVAAQLATLVGPPAPRAVGKTEAAGA